ncbi:nephrin-like isoform X2 [Tubulanus polymorphus]|uniref:nephrin-like isoform X2 n=1 Tax=Tubulanus polymorphus TaxID=672921 RepID=UPI003DA37AE0
MICLCLFKDIPWFFEVYSMYRKNCLTLTVVLLLMMCTGINGQQQNCIDAADTTITAVATPAVVKLGGTTVVQCQVSPTSKDFCGHGITLSSPSRQFALDKTDCPRGTITENNAVECDVTAGRYGLRITNVQMTDAGEWSCDYMNSFPNTKTVITVVAPPSGPVLRSQPNTTNNNIVAVQENSPLTITCDGSQPGATGLAYIWSGVNLSGQSNNKLSFTAVSKTDSGVYTCTVSNTYGTVTGRITINVQFPPDAITLTEIPNGPVVRGTSKTLTCTTDSSNPVSTIMWAYSSGTITWTNFSPNPASNHKPGSHSGQISTSSLVVPTDKGKNGRQYRCTAYQNSQPVDGVTNSTTLSILFPATKLTNVKKPADYVLVNDNQQIECKTDSSNPAVQIQWFTYSSTTWTLLDPQPATSQTSAAYHGFVANSTLSITATKTMNQARYRCQTGNLYNDTTITVHFPPESITLTEIPNGPVVQGTSKTLTCTTDSSNPVSSIMWAYNSGTKTWTNISLNPAVNHKPGSHSGQISTSSLAVPTDKDKNRRQYRCTAYQNSQPVNSVTKSMTLSILYAADSVSLTPFKSVIKEGDSVRLNCEATGGNLGSYTYTWQYLTVSGVWKSIASTNKYLAIENLSRVNSGQYRCQMTNTVGFTISNIAIVDVQYAPQLSSQIEPVAAKIGESGRFTINYDANPRATTLDCNHELGYKAILPTPVKMYWIVTIRSVQAADYGSHYCQLKNLVGSLKITLDILDIGPPKLPSNLTIVTKTAVSVTLTWISEFACGSVQTFTVSYRASHSTEFVNKAEIPDPGYRKLVQTKITGLKPATDYQFKVKSVNSNPGDNTSSFTDIVTTRTDADDKSTSPLIIVGVVFGIIAFVLIVILLIALLIKQLRNGGLVFMNRSSGMTNKTKDSTTVYSNSNELKDTDSRDYAAATPYVNVAFCEIEPEPNNYEEVRN